MKYDLIIIGGGLVGAGLAVALRSANLHIALVDARLPSSDDPRLFALNNSSCQFLTNIGLWPTLAPHAQPIQQVHVSNQGHFGTVRLHSEDVCLPTLGHVIPARYIEAALNDELVSLPKVTLYRPARLIGLQQDGDQATLTLETESGEKILHSPLVIGADGTASSVRALLNIEADVFDYQQSALVTRTTLQRSHHSIAYERFNSDGAIAMLPLSGNECATIWSASNEKISQLMALTKEEFIQRLQNEFGYRLGRLQTISERHVFPLRMVKANKTVDQCVFLLGNSAHTFHPIAAQGFNLALYEVALLVEAIMEKMTKQKVFTTVDLQKISVESEKQQTISMTVSHRLSQVFSQPSMLKSIALQMGMIGLNTVMPIKKKFIKGLMGRGRRTPELLLRN